MKYLFSELTAERCRQTGVAVEDPVSFCRGEELYRYGKVGILLSGRARILRQNDFGTVVPMRFLEAGECFGVASVFGEWKQNASRILAVTPVTVQYLTEENLRRIFAADPAVAERYIGYLTDRIRFLNRKIDTFSAGTAEQRVYEFLLSRADGSGPVTLEFGMAELARRLRIGRSSLYRAVGRLEQNGLIRRENNQFYLL